MDLQHISKYSKQMGHYPVHHFDVWYTWTSWLSVIWPLQSTDLISASTRIWAQASSKLASRALWNASRIYSNATRTSLDGFSSSTPNEVNLLFGDGVYHPTTHLWWFWGWFIIGYTTWHEELMHCKAGHWYGNIFLDRPQACNLLPVRRF